MKKRIYFVRHGESEGNVGNLRGHPDHPLTERGRRQAQFIAERCVTLPIEAMVVSTMLRAQDTASYIAEKLRLVPSYSDLLVEVQGPSEFRGMARDFPGAEAYEQERHAHFEDPLWRFSDAENFEDVKARALAALDLLAARDEEHILVVTHGFFMRFIIACVVAGRDLTAKEGLDFIRTFHMENTGLSVLGYDASKQPKPWWLWVWNDHAHLA